MSLFDELNSLEDVDRLLIDAGVREGETIDYKQLINWDKEKSANEVAKDVSAFANSAGGLLVYGVGTRKDGDSTVPGARVGLDPVLIPKVQRAIADLVRHPIPGVRWKSLPPGARAEVFVVDIPASPLAPHQHAREKVYYRREGDQSKSMPHELVELYFGRRLGPVLRPSMSDLLEMSTGAMTLGGLQRRYSASVRLANLGAGTARDVLVSLNPAAESAVVIDSVLDCEGRDSLPIDEIDRLLAYRVHLTKAVIHPTDEIVGLRLQLRVRSLLTPHHQSIALVRLYADRMAPSDWTLSYDRFVAPGVISSLAIEPRLASEEDVPMVDGAGESLAEADETS